MTIKRPFVWMLAAYVTGLVLGAWAWWPLAAAACSLIVCSWLKRAKACFLLIMIPVMWAGCLRMIPIRRMEERLPEHIHAARVTCTVESCREVSSGWQYTASLTEYVGKACIYGREKLLPGSVFTADLELARIRNAGNPGEFDEEGYQRIRGVYYGGRAENIRIIGQTEWKLTGWLGRLQGQLAEGFDGLLPREEAGIMKAILLGQEEALDADIRDTFRRVGIAHILAISGLHVGMLYTMIRLILGRGKRPKRAALLSIAVIWGYTFLTGGAVSTLRAALFCMISAAQRLWHGREDRLNSYTAAMLLILLVNPLYLYDMGFRLSFVSAASILFFSNIPMRWFCCPKPVRRVIAPAVVAFAGSLPLSLYYFNGFSPYQLLLNLLVLPLMGLVFGMGAVVLVLGRIWRPAAVFGSGTLYYVLRGIRLLAEKVSGLPGAFLLTGRPRIISMVLYALCWMMLLWMMHHPQQAKRVWKLLAFSVCLLIVTICLPGPAWRCTFLNVGQGDCCVVESGRKVYLVDGGPGYDTAIKPYLRSRGIRTITGVFVSHGDKDHVEGLLRLAEDPDFTVEAWYLPAGPLHQNEAFSKLEAHGTVQRLRTGDVYESGNLRWICLSPDPYMDYEDENSASMVLRLDAGGIRVLFTGDADLRAEAVYARTAGTCEVLKVGHHGSRTSTGEELLTQIRPSIGIISCDREGGYGHPHTETVQRLQAFGVRVLVTEDTGALIVEPFRGGWAYRQGKKTSIRETEGKHHGTTTG
ncbi:MAG: DNA internalization-related competence protein ComEC/Rec2 [Firmicutes bacterium]|nr:DNA internalization-related competence protein ComEC/Rec2 [Bacillota bacterium]